MRESRFDKRSSCERMNGCTRKRNKATLSWLRLVCCRHEVPVTSEPITVIHMDEDVVVVNKPASIPVSGVLPGLYCQTKISNCARSSTRGQRFCPRVDDDCSRSLPAAQARLFLARSRAINPRLFAVRTSEHGRVIC